MATRVSLPATRVEERATAAPERRVAATSDTPDSPGTADFPLYEESTREHDSGRRRALLHGLHPLVIVVLGASACAQPVAPGQPAAPGASSANVSTAAAPDPGATSGTPGLCFPPVAEDGEWQRSPWTETARTTDGAGTYALAESASRGATAGFDPALLWLRGSECEGAPVYETDSESGTDVRPPDAVWEALPDESFAWYVREAGGHDPGLRACIPQTDIGVGVDFYETARASDGADEYVRLQWAETLTPNSAFDYHPVLLRLRGGRCEVLLPPMVDYAMVEDVLDLVPASVLDEVKDEELVWSIAVAGGADAYDALWRQLGGTFVECAGEPDGECDEPSDAPRLRRAGLDVRPPVSG